MSPQPFLFTPDNLRRVAALSGVLRSREGRYLGLAAVVAPALLGAATAFWQSPWSPVALERPAQLVAAGDLNGAVAAYGALAQGPGPESVREEAAWRAAQLTAFQAHDPASSVAQLKAWLNTADSVPAARRAEALALCAGLESLEMGAPLVAATDWEQAASLQPDHPDAGRWLLEAGKAFARAGQVEDAHRTLSSQSVQLQDPGGAWLALARLHLAEDPAAAYDAYDRALRATSTGTAQHALARLGLATALERLEGREAALAELDQAWAEGDVVDRSLIRRRQRLESGL